LKEYNIDNRFIEIIKELYADVYKTKKQAIPAYVPLKRPMAEL